jgi:ribosomal protein L32E
MARTSSHKRTPKPERERVAVVHPSGKYTVLVSPARAETLIKRRGWARSTSSDAPKLDRAELATRAKAVGVPVKGTNEALLAAVVAAEAAR